MSLVVEIPMPIPSAANLREHWAKKAKRVKQQRSLVRIWLSHTHRADPPWVVTLTRVAPRPLDDDNLRGALKACRDGVADWLGIDDASPDVEFRYGQHRGKAKYQAVRIEVYEAAQGAA